jgi:hypothetical protein
MVDLQRPWDGMCSFLVDKSGDLMFVLAYCVETNDSCLHGD